MKRVLLASLCLAPLMMAAMGCGDTKTIKRETTVETPGGSTTTTTTQEVKKTGDHKP